MEANVATLIGNPDDRAVTPEIADRAAAAVEASAVYFLADGIACDVPLPPGCANPLERIRDAIAGAPVDVVVQEQAGRRKKALIADMDSTMIQQECIDELAAEAGLKERVSAITARAMNGEIEFEAALRERVSLLKGLDVSVISKVIDERITMMPGGNVLLATMLVNGGYCALVSGGFTAFTGPVAQMLGFDEHRSNQLESKAGKLTGRVIPPILGQQAKVDALNDIAAARNLAAADFVAVGDGANDLGMLDLAGTGVALHAKPVVAKAAQHRIDHGDLTALLYIQGYRQQDFVA